MAETLGTAELVLTVNDKALREGLAKARSLIEDTSVEVGRRSRPRSTSSSSSSDPSGFNERDLVRRFNLRGVTRSLEQLSNDLSQINSGRQINIRSSWTKFLVQLAEVKKDIDESTQAGAIAEGRRVGRLNTSPVRGGAAFPGSPAFLDSIFPKFPTQFFKQQEQRVQLAAKRRADILSNAIIGGAFPLLFGQGAGASLGGAAGGAAGGAIGGQFGFGLSLVGTALGAQFDAALNKAKELAKALDNPITQFSAIKENALLSSKGLEKNVEALIATGREAEAAAIIQEDLSRTFGNVQEVQNFANETDKLNRAWGETSLALAAFISGPLAGLLNRLNEPLRGFNVANRATSALRTLAPDERAQIEQFTRKRQRELGVPSIGASDAESLQLNLDILAEIERIQGKNNVALERAANNQRVLVKSAQTLAKLEEAIGRARIGGNKPLEESLQLSKALLSEYRKRKDLEQQLAAKRIQAPEFSEKFKQSQQDERSLQQNFIDASRESLVNAVQELQITKQLSGLEGARLEVARRRIELSKAFQAREQRGEELTRRYTDFFADPENQTKRVLFQGAQDAFATAGVDFENKLRQASDYLKKAAKDAADGLTNAILGLGKLEADPGGLNRFLTRDEQFESTRRGIVRLGDGARTGESQLENAITKATELLGLTRNQANERFQGLRDIFAGAKQGRFASQEGFNTLSQFIEDVRTREQATTGLSDARKTLADVTSLNVTVQKELLSAVSANTLALDNLFGKDWSVNLSVQGGEVAAYGDVISRNLTP